MTRHPRNLLFVKSFTCFFFTGKMDTRRDIVELWKSRAGIRGTPHSPPKNQNKTNSQGFQSWGTFQLCKFWFCHHSKTNVCAIMALKLENFVFCFVFYENKRAAISTSRTIFHFTADNLQSWQWAVFTETNFPSINSLDEKIQPEEKGSTNFLPKLLWTPRGSKCHIWPLKSIFHFVLKLTLFSNSLDPKQPKKCWLWALENYKWTVEDFCFVTRVKKKRATDVVRK